MAFCYAPSSIAESLAETLAQTEAHTETQSEVQAETQAASPAPEQSRPAAVEQDSGDIGRLTAMEMKYFGAENVSHSFSQRIDRLEAMIFGQATKTPLQSRINRLELALGTAPSSASAASAVSDSSKSDSTSAPEPAPTAMVDHSPSYKPTAKSSSSSASPSASFTPSVTHSSTAPSSTLKVQTFESLSQLAVDDYAAKRYHAAAEHLMQALQHNNKDARTYYRLGDVLTKLQDQDGAKEAYEAAFSIDPFGAIGSMAKQQLLSRAKTTAYKATAPQDTPIVVARTVNWLNRQSNDVSARYNREGQDWQQWRSYMAGIEAAKIRQETQLALANLNQNNYANNNWRGNALGVNTLGGVYGYHTNARHYGYGGGYGANNAANQYDREEISNLGDIRANYVLTDGRVQGNRARQEAAEKAANVQESAANLKDLMLQPTKSGGAHLRALGTNLYVRYYGDETPSYDYPIVPDDPVEELRAQALRLSNR
jgi:tetratricopeptide (TPR) repeat protein